MQYTQSPIQIEQVSAGSPAQRAGLQSGDKIVSWMAMLSTRCCRWWITCNRAREGRSTLTVDAQRRDAAADRVHPLRAGRAVAPWIHAGTAPRRSGAHQPMKFSARRSARRATSARENSLMIVKVLERLLTQKVSVKQLSGPVGIAVAAGQAVKEGVVSEVWPGGEHQPEPRNPEPVAVPDSGWRPDPAAVD